MEEKELFEIEELNKSKTILKMNKKSEMIIKQKMQKNQQNNNENNEDGEAYDLWPVMEKNYFEK
jgi:hypothetical protein